MPLDGSLSEHWRRVQGELFPWLEEHVGTLGPRHRLLVTVLEFARIAGGENMRAQRWQRVRHRWNRKFLYLFRQFGRPYCTGCGWCSRGCTADINIVDVTNRLIEAAPKESGNG